MSFPTSCKYASPRGGHTVCRWWPGREPALGVPALLSAYCMHGLPLSTLGPPRGAHNQDWGVGLTVTMLRVSLLCMISAEEPIVGVRIPKGVRLGISISIY